MVSRSSGFWQRCVQSAFQRAAARVGKLQGRNGARRRFRSLTTEVAQVLESRELLAVTINNPSSSTTLPLTSTAVTVFPDIQVSAAGSDIQGSGNEMLFRVGTTGGAADTFTVVTTTTTQDGNTYTTTVSGANLTHTLTGTTTIATVAFSTAATTINSVSCNKLVTISFANQSVLAGLTDAEAGRVITDIIKSVRLASTATTGRTNANVHLEIDPRGGATNSTSSRPLAFNPPVVTTSAGTTSYTENATATVIDSGFSISGTFASGNTLRVEFSSVGGATSTVGLSEDELTVSPGGTAPNNVTVSGATVSVNGTSVATITAGSGTGGSDLILTFSIAPTADQVQAIARRIAYRNTSEAPDTRVRTVAFNYTTGGGTGTGTKNVSITAVNDAPTVTAGGTANYTENNTSAPFNVPVLVNTTGTVADVDSADLNGGALTVTIAANGSADDRLSIVPGTPSGFLAISVSGANVLYGASVIGTFTGGTGTTPLVITFNSALATPTAATALLRQIGFANVSDNPTTLTRQLSYSLTDGDGGTSNTPTSTVTVTGVDDPPTFNTVPSSNVAENTVTVGDYSAVDPEGQTVTYAVSGTDAAFFSISSAGILSFNVAPDYENPLDAGANNVYDVTVTATAGGQSNQINVPVSVTAVNDNAPVANFSLTHNVSEGTTAVTTVAVTDADLPTNLTVFGYSIVGGADAAKFTINPTTGVLAFAVAPDFENPTDSGANNVYNVTVRVTDGHPTNPLTTDFAITATVTNVNPGQPVFVTGDTLSVNENTQNVAQITASDSDGHALTFSIVPVAQGGAADAALFEFAPNPTFDAGTGRTTAQLRFVSTAGLDYETVTDTVFHVTVKISDGQGAEEQTNTEIYMITVNPVNEAAPVWTTAASQTVSENNTGSLTSVASLAVTDADLPAATIVYAITGGADASLFEIVNGNLQFKSTFDVDAQADNEFEVTVTAYDGTIGGADTRSTARTFTVTVNGVSDVSPVFPGANQSNQFNPRVDVNYAENSTATVATATATDGDKFPTETLTYSLVAENDYQKFSINPTTGVLTFNSAPDYENPTDVGGDNVYEVMVQASDGTNVGTTEYFVAVTPENEFNPTITSGSTANYTENSTVNVLTVTATDADLPGATLNFAITGGADAGLFSLNSSTGVLTFQTSPDRENPGDANGDGVYEVTVTAYDGVAGQPGTRSGSQNVTVTLLGLNDNAPVIVQTAGVETATVAEGTTSTGQAFTATDADIDPAQTATLSLVGDDAGDFTLNATTGELSFATVPNFEAPADSNGDNVYNVTIRATDGTHTTDLPLTVTVGNLTWKITTNVSSVSYTENGAALPFDTAFVLVDEDPGGSALLGGGQLAVDAAGGNRANRVSIASTPTLTNSGIYFETGSPYRIYYNGVHFANSAYGTNPGVATERARYNLRSDISVQEFTDAGATLPEMVQALLRSLRYSNGSDATGAGFTTLAKFSVIDGTSVFANTFMDVVLTPTPDAPVFSGGSTAVRTYTEGGVAIAVDSGIGVMDPDLGVDDTTVYGAYRLEATIADPQTADELVLVGVTVNPTTGAITTSTGTNLGTFTRVNDTTLAITVPTTANKVIIDRAVRAIGYRNNSNAPSTAQRTVNLTVREPAAWTDPLSGTVSRTVTVSPVNSVPVLASSATPVSYTEGNGAVLVATDLVVSDPDTSNFGNGKLTVSLAAAKAGDVLQIVSETQSQEAGKISYVSQTATTGSVFYGSTQIGTVALTSSSVVVTLNGSATQAATQALARTIGYQSTANAFAVNDSRVVRFQLNDGFSSTANSNLVSVTVNITDVNDAPVLGPSTLAAVTYTENGGAVAVASTLTVADPDLLTRTSTGNFTGAALTVSYPNGVGTAADELNIGAIGGVTVSAPGSSNETSRTVSVGGTEVGSVVGGVGITPLVITWNASATLDRVQLVGRAVTYRNTSENPVAGARSVRFVLGEARESAVSNTLTQTVNVVAVNDAPALAFTAGAAVTYTEDAGAIRVLENASLAISDVDNTTFNLGVLQVRMVSGGATTDRLSVVSGNGVTLGTGANAGKVYYDYGQGPVEVATVPTTVATTSLKVTFNGSATLAAVNAVAGQVGYATTSQDPNPTTSRTVGITFFDGKAWNTPGEAVQAVAVQAVNDAPVVKLATTVGSWVEQAVPVLVDSTAVLTDVDTTVFNGGVLTVALASEIQNGQNLQTGFVQSADDRLTIVNSTTNAGVKVVEGAVQVWDAGTVAFVTVGALTGAGTSASPLVVTFNGNATVARAQLVARAVAFRSVPANADNPTPGQRAVTFTLSDGDTNVSTGESSATSVTVARLINVVAKNDNATLTGLASVTTPRANAARLAVNGVVSDPDSANFGGGYLSVEITAGRDANDVLEIATGYGFTVDEFNMVTYTNGPFSGVIGSVNWQSVDATTKKLTVSLESNVTPAIAQALTRAIQYRYGGASLAAKQTKTMRWTLSDGDLDVGQLPNGYNQTVTVNP